MNDEKNQKFLLYIKGETSQNMIYPHTYILGEVLSNVFIPSGSVHSCRETFQTSYLRNHLKTNFVHFVLTVHPDCIITEFQKFIKLIEKQLNIKDSINIYEVENVNRRCVVVKLNEWWLKSKIRQEFVTILLRCYSSWVTGAKTNKTVEHEDLESKIDEILFSQPYFNSTQDAVKYFLSGRTVMKKPFKADVGWHRRFKDKIDNGNPEEVLVGLLSDQVVTIDGNN